MLGSRRLGQRQNPSPQDPTRVSDGLQSNPEPIPLILSELSKHARYRPLPDSTAKIACFHAHVRVLLAAGPAHLAVATPDLVA